MVRGHERDGGLVRRCPRWTEVVEAASKAAYGFVGVQEGARGGGSEGDDHPRVDGSQLFEEIGATGGYLFGAGVAIVGRATFEHVADVDVVSLQAHGDDHFG